MHFWLGASQNSQLVTTPGLTSKMENSKDVGWLAFHSLQRECSDYTFACSPGYVLCNKLGLCLHSEDLRTILGGARSDWFERIGTVWDEEICPWTIPW